MMLEKEMKKKLSIICFSGDFDKAIAAFTLATGAAAFNYEVNMFFTFWGLNIIKKKKGRSFTGRGFLSRTFGFLMGGFRKLPMSRLNFMGFSPKIMTHLTKKRGVATLNELLEAAIMLKINFYVCDMSMNILGISMNDFISEVKEVLGVGKFLKLSDGGETLFI